MALVAARHASPLAEMEGLVAPRSKCSKWIVGDQGLEGEKCLLVMDGVVARREAPGKGRVQEKYKVYE